MAEVPPADLGERRLHLPAQIARLQGQGDSGGSHRRDSARRPSPRPRELKSELQIMQCGEGQPRQPQDTRMAQDTNTKQTMVTHPPIVLRGGPRYDGVEMACSSNVLEIIGDFLGEDTIAVDVYAQSDDMQGERTIFDYVLTSNQSLTEWNRITAGHNG